MESAFVISIVALAALLLLIALGVHIAIVMGVIGLVGFWWLGGMQGALASLAITPYSSTTNFLLAAIPLFLLMGTLAMHTGITTDLYNAMSKWIGHLRGGLGMATIAGCAGFAAVSGSSLATSATMGAIAIPEMRRQGYDSKFAAGCVAAGGTLGIMIPPSILFILYGWLTEVSVGKMFIAGILPGLLSAFLYMVLIVILPVFVKNPYPRVAAAPWSARLKSLPGVIPIISIFVLIMGGIYGGLFTPTEAAAAGLAGTLIIGLARKKLSPHNMQEAVLQAGWTTAMIFAIVVGASMLMYFLALAKFPAMLSTLVVSVGVSRWLILIVIVFMYLILGMFLDPLGMLLLTLPVIFPVVSSLGFDGIWFGIIVCKIIEIGLITPPVGINVYVIAGVAKDIPVHQIFLGIVPFLIVDVITIALLIIFPQISLFLPAIMW